METRLSSHSAYQLSYHVVFVTKYRRKVLNPGVSGYIKKVLPKLLDYVPGVEIITMGIDKEKRDHIHLEMIIPPKYSKSKVVGVIKARSSKVLRQKFKFLSKVRGYEGKNVLWSVGYYVSSLGYDEEAVRKYIEWQGRQDLGQNQLGLLD
jgi:putative transposase